MPVGKVFDATQQVLFSPVSNYYKGEAIRAGLKREKQEGELTDLKIDIAKDELENAPSAREAARKKALLDAENIQSSIDERYAKGEREALKRADEVMKPLFQAYNDAPDDEAESVFNTGLPEALSQLPKEMQENFRKMDLDHDGRFNHDEIMRAGLARRTVEEKEKTYSVLSMEEKLAMGMRQDWAENAIVERDELGNLTFNNKPTGMTAEDLESRGDPRTDSQRGAYYQENIDEYNESSDVQELITSTLPQVIEMPGAVGAKGAMTTAGAGFLTSIGQDEMAGAFAQYMSGATQEEVAALQTQLQTLRGRVTDILTGEGSSRLSETERAIASNAVGLIDQGLQGPSDLTKAYPRVVGAMNQLYAESWATKYRLAKREPGIDYPYDLSNHDDKVELATEFSMAGVDEDTFKRTLVRLQSIQDAN